MKVRIWLDVYGNLPQYTGVYNVQPTNEPTGKRYHFDVEVPTAYDEGEKIEDPEVVMEEPNERA